MHARQSSTYVLRRSGRRSTRRRASARGARGWGAGPARAVSRLDPAWVRRGRAGVCADPWRPAPAVRAGDGTEGRRRNLARPVRPHAGQSAERRASVSRRRSRRRSQPSRSPTSSSVLPFGRARGRYGMRAACHAANRSLSDTARQFARDLRPGRAVVTVRGRSAHPEVHAAGNDRALRHTASVGSASETGRQRFENRP